MMTKTKSPGVIRADEIYTLAEFRRRSGLGDYAFREARKAGLPIISLGKKRYILGEDFIQFLRQQ